MSTRRSECDKKIQFDQVMQKDRAGMLGERTGPGQAVLSICPRAQALLGCRHLGDRCWALSSQAFPLPRPRGMREKSWGGDRGLNTMQSGRPRFLRTSWPTPPSQVGLGEQGEGGCGLSRGLSSHRQPGGRISFDIIFFCLFVCLAFSRAPLAAYRGSQARG